MRAVERAIARVAGRQDNVIALEHLLKAGLGEDAVAQRVKGGSMQRLHRGIFLLGAAPPTQMARARAAVMACREGAVLSHRSAAELFRLLPETGGEVEVEAAFQEALYRDIVSPDRLAQVLAREPRRKGAPVIRALLEDPRMTRSERERALLRLIDQAQLPRPLTNVRLHGYLADAYWPAEGLVIEFDGWQGHGHRNAFERDRKRDQVMLANGLRPMRVTDRHLKHESVALVARIAQSLRT